MGRQLSFLAVVAAGTTLLASVAPCAAETLAERGAYLVEGIAACGTCHARPGGESAAAPGDLAGGISFRLHGYSAQAPNITPDVDTGIGKWSDADIVRALRQGRRPNGSRIGGMPFELYRHISDRDALAIAAYLRSLRPVRNQVPRGGGARPAAKTVPHEVAEVPRSDTARYGAYLAGPVGRCIECHTPAKDDGRPDYDTMLGAGGTKFSGPWGEAIAGNITPDPDTGLGEFTDEQVKEMVVRGIRPNRTTVGRPMAHAHFSRLTAEDLDAIVAYLRSLGPIKNFIDK